MGRELVVEATGKKYASEDSYIVTLKTQKEGRHSCSVGFGFRGQRYGKEVLYRDCCIASSSPSGTTPSFARSKVGNEKDLAYLGRLTFSFEDWKGTWDRSYPCASGGKSSVFQQSPLHALSCLSIATSGHLLGLYLSYRQ
jgi:hypothetical protein